MDYDVNAFRKQGKNLEESFFAKENEAILRRLRKEAESKAKREALSQHSGITDPGILDKLVELDVNVERVTALALVPLVEVAWADGTLSPAERGAILKAAAGRGITSDCPAGQLLANWLEQRPDTRLLHVWVEYVGAFASTLSPDHRDRLRHDMLDRAREVARAAGGFLGVGSISAEEKRVLEEMEKAFG